MKRRTGLTRENTLKLQTAVPILNSFLIGILVCYAQPANGMARLQQKQNEIANQQLNIARQKLITAQEEEEIEKAKKESLKKHPKTLSAGIYAKKVQKSSFVQLAVQSEDQQIDDSVTCGIRCLMFAKSIDTLIDEKKEITPSTLHTALVPQGYATRVNEFLRLKKPDLESQQFLDPKGEYKELAPHALYLLGTQDNRVISLGKNEEEEMSFEMLDALTQRIIPDELQALSNEKDLSKKKPLHFICSEAAMRSGGSKHWILFSVVRSHNGTTVWFIDPLNGDFDNGAWGAPLFAEYITFYIPNLAIPSSAIK